MCGSRFVYGKWARHAISSELAPGDGRAGLTRVVYRIAQADRLPSSAKKQMTEFEF